MPNIHVDGHDFHVPGGQNLLEACLGLGFNLPFFCWHPALGSVGACRQCAVKHFKDASDQQAGRGRLVMACMTPADDGSRISIADPEAGALRKAVIEGMMLHHPHDCPVCDEGGHCHLQDMTVMTGHNYRRYRFAKRTFRNQYLGPLLHHEMNRCIQCYRCVRFYREYAGGEDLQAFGIGDRVFFGRERDGVLESAFAGNLAEVCPTGVFTDARLKRHYTRKWDLRWSPSICPHCALGCNTSLGLRPGDPEAAVRVVVNRYHGAVNGYFLCDRGRFGHEYLSSPRRLRTAAIRNGETSIEITPDAALGHLRRLLREAQADPPGRLIGIGSPRASLESNFALRQLVGPERFYAGVEAGEFAVFQRIAEILRSGLAPPPSLREVEACDAVLILGEDLTQTAARLALSLRQAARQLPLRQIADPLQIPRWLDHAAREALQDACGPVYIATPAATKLDDIATAFRADPAGIARLGFAVAQATAGVDAEIEEWRRPASAIAAALLAAECPLIVAGSSCGNLAQIDAAFSVVQALRARGRSPALSFVLPECNSLGLALLDPLPLREGMDLVRFGAASSAVIVENDLFRRAPAMEVEAFLACFGARLAEPGRHLIVLDQLHHPTAAAAELLLPAAAMAEGDGTVVNNEGRAQRFYQVVPPAVAVQESWRWLEHAQGRKPELDNMITRLCRQFPSIEPVRRAAPPEPFRLAQQKVPREPHRFSGRTALEAHINVSEPRPPQDRAAPLSFTMEGYAAQPPAPLTPFFWAPGWNSPQAQLSYQDGINGPLRGGDAGARLFNSAAPSHAVKVPGSPPPVFHRRPGHWLLFHLFHLFGSEELSQLSEPIGQFAPKVYLALNADDAASAGLHVGHDAEVHIAGRTYLLPLRLLPELPAGLAAVPAGFAAFDGAGLPAWVTIAPVQGSLNAA